MARGGIGGGGSDLKPKDTVGMYFLDFVPKTPLLRPFEICTENEIFQNIDRNVIFSLKRSLNKSRIGM